MQQQGTVSANKKIGIHKKENVPGQKKRARAADESGPTALKVSKFRRSNTSAATSVRNCAVVVTSILNTDPVPAAPVPAFPSNFPVEPNVRAKQMQLFGTRSQRPGNTTSVPPKKGKSMVPSQQRLFTMGKQIQTTLTESFSIKSKTAATAEAVDPNAASDKENRESAVVIRSVSSTGVSAVQNQLKDCHSRAPSTPSAAAHGLLTTTTTTTTTISTLTTTGADWVDTDSGVTGDRLRRDKINNVVMLSVDRELLASRETASSLRYDTASYGQDWVLHHKSREAMFQPWQMALTGKVEKLRLAVIQTYWESMRTHQTTPATVLIAINNLSRLLNYWGKDELENPTPSKWALTCFVAYRLAFKTEERPEVLWEMSSFWNVFPLFTDWELDRSEQHVNKVETESLRILNDLLDVPLAPMFLSQYIRAAEWPRELTTEYHELSLYLISLATFSSVKDTSLRHVVPSKLAAAALALAVKIANGDRKSGQGFVKHLPGCAHSTPAAVDDDDTYSNKPSASCICRYEFWPLRLEAYANLTYEDIDPVVKGLGRLLRSRPPETVVLKHFFPTWGDNEWQ